MEEVCGSGLRSTLLDEGCREPDREILEHWRGREKIKSTFKSSFHSLLSALICDEIKTSLRHNHPFFSSHHHLDNELKINQRISTKKMKNEIPQGGLQPLPLPLLSSP